MENSPPPLPPANSPTATKSKPSLLAWWGIFPVVVYVALQLIFGWPPKGDHPGSPGFAVGYVVGGCLAGTGISLLAAWIAYRLFRRSSLAGTIVFTLGIALFSLAVLGKVARERLAAQLSAPPSTVPVMTSFADFRFEIPAGWQKFKPEKIPTQAAILRNGPNSQVPEEILKVDVGKPSLPTALKTAQSLVGADGHLVPGSITLDGVEAIRVETPSKTFSRPRFTAVAFRNGRVYLVMAAAKNDADISDAFDHVLKTWHWNETPQGGGN